MLNVVSWLNFSNMMNRWDSRRTQIVTSMSCLHTFGTCLFWMNIAPLAIVYRIVKCSSIWMPLHSSQNFFLNVVVQTVLIFPRTFQPTIPFPFMLSIEQDGWRQKEVFQRLYMVVVGVGLSTRWHSFSLLFFFLYFFLFLLIKKINVSLFSPHSHRTNIFLVYGLNVACFKYFKKHSIMFLILGSKECNFTSEALFDVKTLLSQEVTFPASTPKCNEIRINLLKMFYWSVYGV